MVKDLNRYIDHTLLKADATTAQIKTICEEALSHHFASVCVNSCYVPYVAAQLANSDVLTCCVVGFPLGAMLPEAKAAETQLAVEAGAQEIDTVINVGAAKEHNWDYVERDIRLVVKAAHPKAHVKVIIEACLLTDEEKKEACLCAQRAGADFVKTSTGFSTGGATVEDVKLMRQTVGSDMGVKAAGGVRTPEDAENMIAAGATRLGTSAGVKLVSKQ
ncbi:MAG: deoxyribose-phosphate aldolase [Clostridia bacterium]|nr:deoxyribose-phosphate aldolase [Clostridia bacterium]